MQLTLREYQRAAVDAIPAYFFGGGRGNPLIVAPTGSGKSIILAAFISETLQKWPTQRLLLLAHRKELLQQNFEKLIRYWPAAPVGVYSAGLKSRQFGRAITIAGIASVYQKAEQIGWKDLILIDECHLLNHEGGMYLKLIKDLRSMNPNLRVIGLTATPYRMKGGLLTNEGGLFTDIAYDIDVALLVKQGYLSALVSKTPETQADLSDVHTVGGEFVSVEAEAAMDQDALTQAAITEMEHYLADRKSWIIFCAGVEHAKHVTAALNQRGHRAQCVIGESDALFREAAINSFRNGTLKCLVNCDVLTTGFDAPNIDALVLLRPTKSTGLYVQMCGRGMRLSPETNKTNCIVLDFAGNIERHGPIDAIKIEKRGGGISTAPVKTCPECHTSVVISAKQCPDCGHIFPIEEKKSREPNHSTFASDAEVMSKAKPPTEYLVRSVQYKKHEKAGSAPSLRVTYECETGAGNLNFIRISEWICLQHRGYAYSKAVDWWLKAHINYAMPGTIEIPISIEHALEQTRNLREPMSIFVQKDGKYDRVVSRIYPPFKEKRAPDPEDYMDIKF